MKLLVFVSGNGSNLKFLHKCIEKRLMDMELIVISDRDCNALNYAKENNLKSYKVNYRRENNIELKKQIIEINPDYVVSLWRKIIDKEIVNLLEGKLVNLHYSLLPSFGGVINNQPIDMALDKGCKFIGSTMHYINEKVDDGKIISQAIIFNSYKRDIIISKLFKSGCLQLLNFFLKETGDRTKKYDEIYFNPPLKLSDDKIKELFESDFK